MCSSSTDLKNITIFRYIKRSAIFFSNTCGAIVKKKKKKNTVLSTNEDWSWKISPSLCWTFRNWCVLYFNFLSLMVKHSRQFTWQGHRKLQWAMSKDEPLLSNCPLETAEPSRNYARVPGYKKKCKKKTRKRREKKRKRSGVEINTRAYVASRLLVRWDYLYAVTLKTKVFGDYNHARLEVSWITSTRGLLLRGYTGLSKGWVRRPSGLASLHHSRLSTRSSYQLYSFSGIRRFCYDNHGSFVYDSPNLFCGPSGSVRTGLTGVRSEPGHRTHLTSLLLARPNWRC